MLHQNRNILIIAMIAVVNALGYGIIIPILYAYSRKYGLTDFQNGLLFALFSVGQFLSTPLIGRLSDKYGRKPLLVISLAGTALSFFIMAFAPNAFFLFVARTLDGLTAGNIPVASAVISDTTDVKNRAKGFGIIGASFGFGFIFGPAITAFTVSYGEAVPFIIAGVISLIAVVLTAIFLPETNQHMGEVKKGSLFNFDKLYHALFDPNVGTTLLITFFYFLAFSLFIYAFQSFTVNVLKLNTSQVSLLYTVFGAVGLISQIFLVQRITKVFGLKKTFQYSIAVVAVSFFLMFFSQTVAFFVITCILLALSNAVVQPLSQTILSQETDAKSQGTIMGLNASYMSIGQIVGPIIAGAIAMNNTAMPFLAGSLFIVVCFYLSFHVLRPGLRKESTF